MKLSAQSSLANPIRHLHSTGFTLIELMVVVGIIALISGAILPNFSTYIANQNRKQAQEQIKSDLRTIQNRALTGVGYTTTPTTSTHWGIRFAAGDTKYSYIKIAATNGVIAYTDCPGGATAELSTTLNSNQVIRMAAGTVKCIFFSFDNGDATYVNTSGAVNTTCTTDVCYIPVGEAGATTCSQVGVNKSGLIVNTGGNGCT